MALETLIELEELLPVGINIAAIATLREALNRPDQLEDCKKILIERTASLTKANYRLEQLNKQEPTAWMDAVGDLTFRTPSVKLRPYWTPLYLHSAPIPEGWVMVPKEPTAAMDFAGAKAADEIERLEKENESLKASVYGLYELEKELYEIQAREEKLREALNTTLGCVDVYYIPALKDEFALADAPYDDTALKEYRKKVLLEAADWFSKDKNVCFTLHRMAEE